MSDVEDPNLPFSFALLCVPPPLSSPIVRSFAAVNTDTFSSYCVLIVRIKMEHFFKFLWKFCSIVLYLILLYSIANMK